MSGAAGRWVGGWEMVERETPAEGAGAVTLGAGRRILDVLVAAIGLLLTSPIQLAVAAAVRLEGPGPVIFRQVRLGEGGRPFIMLKFRTMREGEGGPDITGRDDPRVTRVGRLLRRISLDELPQLANVLCGEMTLVGPRPETPELAAGYGPPYDELFRHRPGITGPGQLALQHVHPPKGANPETFYFEAVVPRRYELDMAYLRRPTVGRTLRVLAVTAGHVLRVSKRGEVSWPVSG